MMKLQQDKVLEENPFEQYNTDIFLLSYLCLTLSNSRYQILKRITARQNGGRRVRPGWVEPRNERELLELNTVPSGNDR